MGSAWVKRNFSESQQEYHTNKIVRFQQFLEEQQKEKFNKFLDTCFKLNIPYSHVNKFKQVCEEYKVKPYWYPERKVWCISTKTKYSIFKEISDRILLI